MSALIDLTDMSKYKEKKQWHGYDRYQCPRCPWDTIDKPAELQKHMTIHLKNNPMPIDDAAQEENNA